LIPRHALANLPMDEVLQFFGVLAHDGSITARWRRCAPRCPAVRSSYVRLSRNQGPLTYSATNGPSAWNFSRLVLSRAAKLPSGIGMVPHSPI
jgi:hypothetical protein